MSSPTYPQKNSSEVESNDQLCGTDGIPSVDWWVTSRCNLSCDFCYGPKPARDPLDIRDLISTRISASSTHAVTFCGGEPLLVRNLAEYAKAQQGSGKNVVLNTNGELVRRRFRRWPEQPFNVVGISIDGPDEVTHRRMRGSNADFQETVKAARWLRDENSTAKRKIGTVLSAVNVSQVDGLAKLVRELAPNVWRIYQYSTWGPQNYGRARHDLSDSDFADAVERATEAAAPVPVKYSTTRTTGGCLIVDPDGRVLRQHADSYEAIGSCLDERLEDIWRRAPQQSVVRVNKFWLRSV
jgi:MoaA/NifB/PqqE/SkfB family radical SAM enzyme